MITLIHRSGIEYMTNAELNCNPVDYDLLNDILNNFRIGRNSSYTVYIDINININKIKLNATKNHVTYTFEHIGNIVRNATNQLLRVKYDNINK